MAAKATAGARSLWPLLRAGWLPLDRCRLEVLTLAWHALGGPLALVRELHRLGLAGPALRPRALAAQIFSEQAQLRPPARLVPGWLRPPQRSDAISAGEARCRRKTRRPPFALLIGCCCFAALIAAWAARAVAQAQTAANLDQACAQIAAQRLTPYQVLRMGSSLGLTVDQLNELLQCVGGEPLPTPTPLGQGEFSAPSPTPAPNMMSGYGNSGNGFTVSANGGPGAGNWANGMPAVGMPAAVPVMPGGMPVMPGTLPLVPRGTSEMGAGMAGVPSQGTSPQGTAPGLSGLRGWMGSGNGFSSGESLGNAAASPLPSVAPTPSAIEESFRVLTNPLERLEVRPVPYLKQFGYSLFASPAARFPLINPRPNMGPNSANGQGTASLANQNNPSGIGAVLGGFAGNALSTSGYLPSSGYLAQPEYLSLSDNFPVGPDYVLGPGDELNLLLWGRVN